MNLAYVIIAEKGYLEKQTLLLVRSIRVFGGQYSQAPIYVYSPRTNNPSNHTIKGLKKCGAKVILNELNMAFKNYGFGNKPYVCYHAERTIKADYLLFMDSDQIVTNSIDLAIMDGYDIGICPVEQKKVAGAPLVKDAYLDYWHDIFKDFLIDNRLTITTVIDQVKIYPYFNAGFILVRNGIGLFEKWKVIFEKMMNSKKFPGEITFMDQVSLSVTLLFNQYKFRVLPSGYNYPLNLHHKHPNQIRSLDEIVSLHYHKIFAVNQDTHPLELFEEGEQRKIIIEELKRVGIYPIPHWKEYIRKVLSNVKR